MTAERAVALCICASVAAVRLVAQCPDGTPPPCRGARPAAAPANSVAVLYFDSRSTDTSDLALADGLTEEIINRLTGIERLTVRSRYLVRRYRGTAFEDPASVGRSVNAAYLVTGTVRRAGGRLRVSAELVRAEGGAQVWARQFDQAGDDVFAIQEAVASEVATGIVGRLLPTEAHALAVRPTASVEAYDAYVLGRFYWNKRTAPDLVRAAEYFRQAIRADSTFAQAWSGLADAYVLFIPEEYDVPGINRDSILALAEGAARRAIAIAPRLGEAWASLGEVLGYLPGRNAEAGLAFAQGVVLSPRYPTAHQWYSYWLMGQGRWDEGVREMERAKELDPTSLVITISLVFAYDGAERWGEAEAMVDQSRALDAEHPLTIVFAELFHDIDHRHLERIPADFRSAMLTRLAGDSGIAFEIERRLADPARRAAAIHEIAGGAGAMIGYWRNPPTMGLGLTLAYEGDDAALAFLDALVGTPRAAELADYVVYGMLGPRRRADPRFVAVLARLGIPRP